MPPTNISNSRQLHSPTFLLFIFLLINCFLLQFENVNCYNLSPKPNLMLKEPNLMTFKPKTRSSLFGFTVLLRSSGIFVGAPRAQSTLESQRKINETGAIYRCSLINTTCYPYIFEKNGNIDYEIEKDDFNNEMRDYQWLGGSMDGGPLDTDKFIVCAPRFIAPVNGSHPSDYLMHGICYWVKDTLSEQPKDVEKISKLRSKGEQIVENDDGARYYNYIYAEQGLSVHLTPDMEEFLIGAPGINTWKGSVIRHRRENLSFDLPGLSRRDLSSNNKRIPRQATSSNITINYEVKILKPQLWDQQNDSYFGYAVSSGYFDSENPKKLLYIATAPQADGQSGEAYLFDITGRKILPYFTFRGKLFGEYFGYSVLAVDINNDKLTDVIISAPQHSSTGFYEDGAIYVFMNKGRYNFEQKIYISPVHDKARFGTTLASLGDINHDGYNDIAVGAPFAHKNGAVFIYLGGPNGLREKPSQQLRSPHNLPHQYGAHMFGHGLSKGNDIDGNGFNDFAIGAPNAEEVLLYRAYPVIKVQTSITSQTREIRPEQSKFKATVCYGFSTTSASVQNQQMTLRVVMDPQLKRVKISNTGSNEMIFNVTATRQQQCQVFDCDVRYSVKDIFRPIQLEVHHQVINSVPNSEVFCDYCVATDPDEPKVYTERLIFSTGCATEICVADLSVKSVDIDHTYILGSSRTLTATYEVSNFGETAYLPQINFTSSNHMPFARIPSSCKLDNFDEFVMFCDLNRGQSLAKNDRVTMTVAYVVDGIKGNSMTLTAQVFSTGKEANPANNKVVDIIALKEYTQVDVVGKPVSGHINLEKVKDTAQIINSYEIKSNGPSNIDVFEVVFNIPIAYKIPGSQAIIPIVDLNNITMQAVYDSQIIRIDFYQNQTQLLLNSFETTKTFSTETKTIVSSNGAGYDPIKLGHINEMLQHEIDMGHSLSDSVSVASMSRTARHRRSRRDVTLASSTQTATKDQYARLTHARAHELLDDDMKDRLPVNRTIVFNCNDPTMVDCVRAVMRVYNFRPEKPISVSLKYNVDLNEVNQILIEPWECFVILIGLDVHKITSIIEVNALAVNRKIEYNIISKHQLYKTPIWIIILAVLGGLLLLALLTYGMYKAGFFKRAKKEEMDKLVHQGAVHPEEENLNTEDH